MRRHRQIQRDGNVASFGPENQTETGQSGAGGEVPGENTGNRTGPRNRVIRNGRVVTIGQRTEEVEETQVNPERVRGDRNKRRPNDGPQRPEPTQSNNPQSSSLPSQLPELILTLSTP